MPPRRRERKIGLCCSRYPQLSYIPFRLRYSIISLQSLQNRPFSSALKASARHGSARLVPSISVRTACSNLDFYIRQTSVACSAHHCVLGVFSFLPHPRPSDMVLSRQVPHPHSRGSPQTEPRHSLGRRNCRPRAAARTDYRRRDCSSNRSRRGSPESCTCLTKTSITALEFAQLGLCRAGVLDPLAGFETGHCDFRAGCLGVLDPSIDACQQVPLPSSAFAASSIICPVCLWRAVQSSSRGVDFGYTGLSCCYEGRWIDIEGNNVLLHVCHHEDW